MSGAPRALVMVGLSHRTAPIEIRERFTLHGARRARWLEALQEVVPECVVLSTCNRTECYVAGDDAVVLERHLLEALTRAAGIDSGGARYLRTLTSHDAVTHLFRVVCGLDSLVIGEPQIQGQVSEAYHAGHRTDLGPVLHRLFQSALAAGGRVRSTTSIARGATSIPGAAVNLARKVFGSLEGRAVLVLGTGEMGRLTVECLRSEGVDRVYVASGDLARAERLSRSLAAVPLGQEAALDRLGEMDLLVTCTETDAPLLTPGRAAAVGAARNPLVILDIAVPRNVHPAVGKLADVFLYNVDDLQRVIDQTLEARAVELERAEAVVDRHAAKYWAWYRTRAAAPAIRRLRAEALAIVERGLAARPRAPRDADREAELRLASRTALNKILHAPTQAIRTLAERSDAEMCLTDLEPLLERGADGVPASGTAGGRAG